MGAEDFNLLPPQAWELQTAASAGLTISQFRFTLAFILSVVVGAILRKVPTVRGEPRALSCGGRAAHRRLPPAASRPVARSLPGRANTFFSPLCQLYMQAAMCLAP